MCFLLYISGSVVLFTGLRVLAAEVFDDDGGKDDDAFREVPVLSPCSEASSNDDEIDDVTFCAIEECLSR